MELFISLRMKNPTDLSQRKYNPLYIFFFDKAIDLLSMDSLGSFWSVRVGEYKIDR